MATIHSMSPDDHATGVLHRPFNSTTLTIY